MATRSGDLDAASVDSGRVNRRAGSRIHASGVFKNWTPRGATFNIGSMRGLLVVLGLVAFAATADARRHPKRVATAKVEPRTEKKKTERPDAPESSKKKKAKKPQPRGSVGAPWAGSLRNGVKLGGIEGAHIRRPSRQFGTKTTVEYVRKAVIATLEKFPTHTYAIGDLSQEGGGAITEHHSHQSGRDIDLGLFYTSVPEGYPDTFVTATEEMLDSEAMWFLINKLAKTANKDGGVQVMFLDFEVQGFIYRWAQGEGVDEDKLERIFQYPHGRGSSAGLVRHEPNHDNHLHVRFHCASADTNCR